MLVLAWLASAGCGGVDDGASEVPLAEPRVDAPPRIAQQETLPTGPRVTMEHEHAVDPVADLTAARAEQAELDDGGAQWVALQHRIALRVALQDSADLAAAEFERAVQAKSLHDYAHADEVLFDYAMLSAQAGELEAQKSAFMELIRQHPTSPLVVHVFAAFGDLMDARGDFDDAARLYEKVMMFNESDAPAYGAYRLAWCHLRMDPSESVRALQLFVRSADAVADADGWGAELREAAIEGAVIAYADVGRPARAKAFFTRLTRESELSVDAPLRLLALGYAESGDVDAERVVCADLQDGC